jgi:hypothetical protein
VARTLQPLTDLLKGSPKVLVWSPAAEAAFVAAAFLPYTILKFFPPDFKSAW